MTERHEFTETILKIIRELFAERADIVYHNSPLLQYLNIKTRSAARGSKARGSFANLYALYVLVEDYIERGFLNKDDYGKYGGANFSDLLRRQRELPFGSKLQNHALNARLNEEYKKYFPNNSYQPIIRDVQSGKYWINEHLLVVEADNSSFNIAPAIIQIIDAYVVAKRSAFAQFIADFEQIQVLSQAGEKDAVLFITQLLQPTVDARIFEIVSYVILKYHYIEYVIYWGWSIDALQKDTLTLYKTGRTNANDGGIDFVMKPLGRFFQVTETIDVKKYFLDIDKVQQFPLTFVVKSIASPENILNEIRRQAQQTYGIVQVVEKYMAAIEEVINIPMLTTFLRDAIDQGKLRNIITEIILQSKIEFNYEEDTPK